MRINHFQNTGIGEAAMLTLLVQTGDAIGTETWTKFYSTIEGFDYEPGRVYDVTLKTTPINNPPADGSAVSYTLLDITSTQEVPDETLFDIDLKINGENFITSDSGLQLLNQIDLDCNALCDELDTRLVNQDFVVGTFKRGANNALQLVSLQ
ncbi:hypothetical protein MED217_06971 [Leeuwenhoekiella blandensis MED217]|jgi:hypothetical protein|uniref:DUF4377 domain-containing protein n=2 Tax=Flavobacteriaceae TaxID=49546 RepID=A3XMU2_LEEBM|nr:hypothetical protein MED217_06971 [Leeuwenhoekiella blandensis MED217]|tara:strand:- start:1574 stop:2029 length:456 start_codon:yes stop_codon:yes gene_type:complete